MMCDGTVDDIKAKRKDPITTEEVTAAFRTALRDVLLPVTGKNVPFQVDAQVECFVSNCDASVLTDEFNDATDKLKRFGIRTLWSVSLAAFNPILVRTQEIVLAFHRDWNAELTALAGEYGFYPNK